MVEVNVCVRVYKDIKIELPEEIAKDLESEDITIYEVEEIKQMLKSFGPEADPEIVNIYRTCIKTSKLNGNFLKK